MYKWLSANVIHTLFIANRHVKWKPSFQERILKDQIIVASHKKICDFFSFKHLSKIHYHISWLWYTWLMINDHLLCRLALLDLP